MRRKGSALAPEQLEETAFSTFVAEHERRLREALVCLYGPARGREATVTVLGWMWQDRWAPPADPVEALRRLFDTAQRHSQLFDSPALFDREGSKAGDLDPATASALSLLPRSHRVPLLLLHGAAWTPAEVGELLGMSQERVTRLAARGARWLGRAVLVGTHHPASEEDDESGDPAALAAGLELAEEAYATLAAGVAAVTAEEAMRYPVAPDPPAGKGLASPLRLTLALLAGVVLVVVGIVVGLGATRSTTVTAYTTPGPEPLPGNLASSVIVLPNLPGTTGVHSPSLPTVAEIDAATGQRLAAPAAPHTAAALPPVTTGRYVVDVLFRSLSSYPDSGRAVAFRTGSRHVTPLGYATSAVAGHRAGTVWLFLTHVSMTGRPAATCLLRLVDTRDADVLIGPAVVPCQWQVLAAINGGLLVVSPEGQAEVWDPFTGLTSILNGFAPPVAEAVGSSLVAPRWSRFCSTSCELELADPTTALVTDERVQPPAGVSLTTASAISPNGKFLAVTAVPIAVATELVNSPGVGPDCCDSGNRPVNGRLVVFRLSNGTVALSRPATFLQPSLVEWSANGSYVFLTGSPDTIESVPVWSDAAPLKRTVFPAMPRRPPDPGQRFLLATR